MRDTPAELGKLSLDASDRRVPAQDDLRVREARRRVLRFGAAVVLLGAALVLFLTWRRDMLRVDGTRRLAEGYAQALAQAASGGSWPTTFPPPGQALTIPGGTAMTYVGPHAGLRTAAGRPILAYSAVITSYTDPTGRAIIVADGHELAVEWLPERDFQALQQTPAGR